MLLVLVAVVARVEPTREGQWYAVNLSSLPNSKDEVRPLV